MRRRHQQADGDCLAVQPAAIPGRRLDRVTERVAEVEQRSRPVFALISGDDPRLDLAGTPDGVLERCGFAREQLPRGGFDPLQELDVLDQPVLDHFGETRAQLAWRQSAQRGDIAENANRLMERSDEVLARRVIDAGLAADSRIHLCEQGCGYLQVRDTALIAGCGEPCNVTHDPATQGNDCAVPVQTRGRQGIEDAR